MNNSINGLGEIIMLFSASNKETSVADGERFFAALSSMFSDLGPTKKPELTDPLTYFSSPEVMDINRFFDVFTSKFNNIDLIESIDLDLLMPSSNAPEVKAIVDATLKQVDPKSLSGKDFRGLIGDLLYGLPAEIVDGINKWLDVLDIDNVSDSNILLKLLVFILMIIIMILKMQIKMMEEMMKITSEVQADL